MQSRLEKKLPAVMGILVCTDQVAVVGKMDQVPCQVDKLLVSSQHWTSFSTETTNLKLKTNTNGTSRCQYIFTSPKSDKICRKYPDESDKPFKAFAAHSLSFNNKYNVSSYWSKANRRTIFLEVGADIRL